MKKIFVTFFVLLAIPSITAAQSGSGGVDFSGQISETKYCNCSFNTAVKVQSPLGSSASGASALSAPMTLMYEPGITTVQTGGTGSASSAIAPGACVLGKYSAGGSCMQYDPQTYSCKKDEQFIPIGTINDVGVTSPPCYSSATAPAESTDSSANSSSQTADGSAGTGTAADGSTATTPDGQPFTRDLGPGTTPDPEVARLQKYLNSETGANLKVDGIYGPATRNAVAQFQTAHPEILQSAGLSQATGYFGKSTRAYANGQLQPTGVSSRPGFVSSTGQSTASPVSSVRPEGVLNEYTGKATGYDRVEVGNEKLYAKNDSDTRQALGTRAIRLQNPASNGRIHPIAVKRNADGSPSIPLGTPTVVRYPDGTVVKGIVSDTGGKVVAGQVDVYKSPLGYKTTVNGVRVTMYKNELPLKSANGKYFYASNDVVDKRNVVQKRTYLNYTDAQVQDIYKNAFAGI